MSNLAIRDLEQSAVLDTAEMQSIKGGAPTLVNLFHVYTHPELYNDGLVEIANTYINGD